MMMIIIMNNEIMKNLTPCTRIMGKVIRKSITVQPVQETRSPSHDIDLNNCPVAFNYPKLIFRDISLFERNCRMEKKFILFNQCTMLIIKYDGE
jgi:hypothetical protein